jgi:hypothetical protein
MGRLINEANTYGFPSGSVDSGKVVTGGVNGDWDGSMQRALEVASFAKACSGKSNPISSQKRSRVKTASGNVSDHYEKNLSAYAVDIPASGTKGDELLACIMKKFDNGSHSSYTGNKWLNVNIGGYRYQFGWKVKNHYDHIHVGVKKIGAKTPSAKGSEKTSDKKSSSNKDDDDKGFSLEKVKDFFTNLTKDLFENQKNCSKFVT